MDPKRNFLLDNDFIKWRIFRTEELNSKWEEFEKNNPQYSDELKRAIEEFEAVKFNHIRISEEDKNQILSSLTDKISKYNLQKRRKLILQLCSSAAAILLIVVLSVLYFTGEKSGHSLQPQEEAIIGQALPEEEIVIISGDQKINVKNNASIALMGNSGVVVKDSAEREQRLELSPISTNKLVVPYGKRSSLTLADGSKIWVNSGSQIIFPTEFKHNERKIYVNGEVFINVKHDSQKPFIVQTADMDICVYGTSFNVSAYEDDFTNAVVLVDGKVTVKSDGTETELFPNEKAELINGSFSKEIVDVSEYISWTRDILELNETPVSEILKKIGRYYNINFENDIGASLNDKTYSGKLFLSDNLDSVMVSISHITSTHYKRTDNLIKISKK